MEDGDREKYHVISRIQDFVFYSRKMGCIRCISSQVYNKDWYQTSKLSNYKICAHTHGLVARKPDFVACAKSDKPLCYSLIGKYNI